MGCARAYASVALGLLRSRLKNRLPRLSQDSGDRTDQWPGPGLCVEMAAGALAQEKTGYHQTGYADAFMLTSPSMRDPTLGRFGITRHPGEHNVPVS